MIRRALGQTRISTNDLRRRPCKGQPFLGDIPDYKAAFINYGLPAAFDTALQEAAEAFELSLASVDTAVDEHITGTADTAARIREGMIIIRVLDGGVAKHKTLAYWPALSFV